MQRLTVNKFNMAINNLYNLLIKLEKSSIVLTEEWERTVKPSLLECIDKVSEERDCFIETDIIQANFK